MQDRLTNRDERSRESNTEEDVEHGAAEAGWERRSRTGKSELEKDTSREKGGKERTRERHNRSKGSYTKVGYQVGSRVSYSEDGEPDDGVRQAKDLSKDRQDGDDLVRYENQAEKEIQGMSASWRPREKVLVVGRRLTDGHNPDHGDRETEETTTESPESILSVRRVDEGDES